MAVGEGNYTEKTVKEASRALTGYRYNRLRDFEVNFSRADWDHDKKQKSLLGKKGNFDGLCEIIYPDGEILDCMYVNGKRTKAKFRGEKKWHIYKK